jgi:hypothetical protein
MPKPSKFTAATTKKTKRNARGMATAVILVSVMILIAAAVAAFLYNATTLGDAPSNAPRNPRRITLYTNYDGLDGGPCSYYEYEIIGKTKSKSLKTCVDNVEKASDLIPRTGVYTSSPLDGIRLIKIDADVHTETQKRSPTTPKPQYENREVIVIDNVYSAELFVSNTNDK